MQKEISVTSKIFYFMVPPYMQISYRVPLKFGTLYGGLHNRLKRFTIFLYEEDFWDQNLTPKGYDRDRLHDPKMSHLK